MTDQAMKAQLPRYVTTFVGRAAEQSALRSALGESRFVALVGPGGVGKTRLVSELAKDLADEIPGGVFFADLAQVTNSQEFCGRAANALGMRNSGQVSPALLQDFLRDRGGLVVFDSCDSLDRECLLLLQDIVASSAQGTILATSRRALHIVGGQLMTLSPLSLPLETTGEISLPDVLNSEAAKLFVARARLVRPGFSVPDSQASTLSRLCHRLDGLPLAIELAAAWTRALSIEQIIDRMDAHPDFPRAGEGATDPRHRTLRTLTAGSYELCSDEEKLLWCRLTVFENTFDLPAVEAICSQQPLSSAVLLDLLASLVDQSVVVADDVGDEVRYRLLRLTRDYGESRLAEFGENKVLLNRHLAYYEGSFNRITTDFPGSSERERIERLRLEYSNILAAINYGLQEPDVLPRSLRMAAGLWFFWFAVGQLSEGIATLTRLLASPHAEAYPREREYALCIQAYLSVLQNKLRAAQKLLELASSNQKITGDELNLALAIQVTGIVEAGYGRLSAARELLDRAINGYQRATEPVARIFSMDAIGIAVLLAAFDGDGNRVAELSRAGLDLCDDFDDYMWRGYIEYAVAVNDWIRHEPERARERALKVAGYVHDQLLLAHCLELLAWCAQQSGQNTRAAILFGGADYLWKFMGGHFSGFYDIGAQRKTSLDRCRDALGPRAFDAAHAEGFHTDANDLLLQEAAIQDGIAGPEPNSAVRLTRREKEVAALLGRGLSNREIGSELTISPRTAETHVENILAKFGLENRAQMAAVWARLHPDSAGS